MNAAEQAVIEEFLIPVVKQIIAERDHYREALERIARRVPIMGSTGDYREGQLHALAECAKVASDALQGGEE